MYPETEMLNALGLMQDRTGHRMLVLSQSGSRAYGTDHEESDHDFRGVFAAPLRQVLSLSGAPQSHDVDEPHDIVAYELSHFCKLAAAANPTVLEILWSENSWTGGLGFLLRDARHLFLSKKIVKTYEGFARSQLSKAAKSEKGQGTKAKLHTLRLLDAGIYALVHGSIMVKHPNPERLHRESQLGFAEFEELVMSGISVLHTVADISDLPDEPYYDMINDVIYRIRTDQWQR